MMILFDDETVMRNHDARLLREGEAKGEAKGEARLALLMSKLFDADRINDVARAASDPEYREKLYTELEIK